MTSNISFTLTVLLSIFGLFFSFFLSSLKRFQTQVSAGSLTPLLNPANDFYKKLVLECSESQVAVDLFELCSNYADIATVSPVSKVTGGSVFYYPASPKLVRLLARFECDFEYYLSRSIGFETVLRIRTTKGFSMQLFFGNFFYSYNKTRI
jgi:protein transport protein SEC24